MKCPNCGKGLNPSGASRYTKCANCRSKVAVFEVVSEVTSIQSGDGTASATSAKLIQRMELANLDFEGENYAEASRCYSALIVEEPTLWEAYLNRAVCEFWLGREDFSHMKGVEALLKKAALLSGDDSRVQRVREDLAFNVAAIGAAKEALGDKIRQSILCFELSRNMAQDMAEREDVIEAYTSRLLGDMAERIGRGLGNFKKNYDPPQAELDTLESLGRLGGAPAGEALALLIPVALQKYARLRKSEFRQIAEEARSRLQSEFPSVSERKFVIPLIGAAKVV